MKLHLPLAMLAVLSSSVAMAAGTWVANTSEGNIITGDTTAEQISAILAKPLYDGSSNDTPKATFFMSNATLSGNITTANPIVVLDGTLNVQDANIKNTLSSPITSFVPYLAVGGTSAQLNVVNSTIKHTIAGTENYSVPVIFGTADGAATVSLNNSTISTDHYVFAGDHDGQTDGGTQLGVGYSKATMLDGKLYENTTMTNQTVISLTNNSTLRAGTSLQFANAKVTIDDSTLTDNGRNLSYTTSNHGSYLGSDSSIATGVKTDIDIINGGKFECNWNLYTTASERKVEVTESNRHSVNINVGDGSSFSVAGKAHLGGYKKKEGKDENGNTIYVDAAADTTSVTNVTIKNGGKAELNVVNVGYQAEAKLVVEAGGTISKLDSSKCKYDANMMGGNYSAPVMEVYSHGTVENAGSIGLDVVIKGGVVTAQEGSTFASIYANSGVLNIDSAVTINGELVLGTVVSTLSTESATDSLTLNINYNNTPIKATQGISLGSGLNINVMVDDLNNIKGETFDLFDGIAEYDQLANANLTFTDGTTTVAADIVADGGGFKVTGTTTIPEPTTATLSLLALAGLAARRRRK